MRRNEKITSIMTADPLTVQVGQPLSEVQNLCDEHGFHHVPVCEGRKLVGILSSTDLLKVSYTYGEDVRTVKAVLDDTVTTQQLMNDPISLSTEATVRDAVTVLAPGRFHCVPVVDDEGDLAGIVTTTDILKYVEKQY